MKMFIKKSNIIKKILILGIASTLGLVVTANAEIKLTVINDTDFSVSVRQVEAVLISVGMLPGFMVKETADPLRLQGISPGERKTESYQLSAPGIDKLEYAWTATPNQWKKSGEYHQTGAQLLFVKPGQRYGVVRAIQISQAAVNQDQELVFKYDDDKEATINVEVQSKDNIWQGSGLTRWSWDAKFYDYTITLTQTEPEQGSTK